MLTNEWINVRMENWTACKSRCDKKQVKKYVILSIVEQFKICTTISTLSTKNQQIESAKRVDLDEAAHNELPHLDLLCLSSSLEFSIKQLRQKSFEILQA